MPKTNSRRLCCCSIKVRRHRKVWPRRKGYKNLSIENSREAPQTTWGQPPSAVRRSNFPLRVLLNPCRTLLDWTAEVGCPHVVCGYGGRVIEDKVQIQTGDGVAEGIL